MSNRTRSRWKEARRLRLVAVDRDVGCYPATRDFVDAGRTFHERRGWEALREGMPPGVEAGRDIPEVVEYEVRFDSLFDRCSSCLTESLRILVDPADLVPDGASKVREVPTLLDVFFDGAAFGPALLRG